MSGKDEDDAELYIRLLLGILPFDAKTLLQFLSDIADDAEETSWPQLFRRGTNIGLFIGTVGILGMIVYFIITMNTPNIPLQNFGLIYVFAGSVVLLMFLMKFLIKLLQNVNKGKSILVHENESFWAGLSEFTLGTLMTGTLWLFFSKVGSSELYLITIIGTGIVGISIAGISLTLSGAINVISYSTSESENAQLNEFKEEDGKSEVEH